ncbi:MAG: hypothetical protein ACFFE8_01015 [Candidatus Heimdallarchaeota archaeon]
MNNSGNTFWGFIEQSIKGFRFRLFLFIFVIYIAGATLDVTNTNPGSRFMLTKAIAKYGEFSIRPEDQERYSYLDYSVFNGSIFSDKAPGISLLGVPIYWIGEFFAVNLLGVDPNNWQLVDDVIKFLFMFCVLAFGAFVTVKMYDLLHMVNVSHRNAHITAVFFGLGSLFYVYIGTLFSHGITAGFLVLVLYYGTSFRQELKANSLLWSSIFSGFAIVCDYVLLFLLPFFFLYIFIPFHWNLKDMKRYWKAYLKSYGSFLTLYIIPLVLCGFLVLFYNFAAFGDPFTTPYSYSQAFWDKQHFANSQQYGFDVLVFSRHHGLLAFMPILLVSVFGLFFMLKRTPALAVLTITIPCWILLLYSKYFLPSGGLAYGPRHLVSITPFLIIPLAFLLDARRSPSPFSSMRNLISSIFVLILKIGSLVLGLLTFLISFAGAWVGVYPLGGEGMLDPIWGTADQIGHMDVLLSWFQLSIETHGRISIEVLNGVYEGGFQLDFILFRFKVYLTGFVASSLARGEVNVFVALLFLGILVNPYLSPLEIADRLAKRIAPWTQLQNQKRLLTGFIAALAGMIALFTIWFTLELVAPLGQVSRSSLFIFESEMTRLYKQIEHIPLINYVFAGIGFSILFILKLILLSTVEFALGTLVLISAIFVSVTTITWIPFRQIQILDKIQESNTLKPMINKNAGQIPTQYWHHFSIFQPYLKTSFLSSALYMLIWGYIVVFKVSNLSFYSNLAIIVYSVVFAILVTVALTPFLMNTPSKDQRKSQDFPTQKISQSTPTPQSPGIPFHQIPLIFLSFVTIILIGGHILLDVLSKGMSLSDFLFLLPPTSLTSVRDWFIPVEYPIPVFLTIAFILVLIIVLIGLYPVAAEFGGWRIKLPTIPSEVQLKLETKGSHLSRFQSILFFGFLLILFDFLLLTNLYATLSTVPDPNLLPKPWEDYPEEVVLLGCIILGYAISLIWAGIEYVQSIRSSSHNGNLSHAMVDFNIVDP